MITDTLFSAGLLVQCAVLFYLVGFLIRDELWLRVLVLIGTGFYIGYYFIAAQSPLWDAIWTSVAIGAVNVVIIGQILRERSTVGMGDRTLALYGWFPTLTPGQFRTLLRQTEIVTAETETVLCTRDRSDHDLFLISAGTVMLERAGKRVELPEGNFVGEISFLLGRPATATVTAAPGTTYLRWDREKLRTLLAKYPALSNAVTALFNRDIARKLALSWPDDPSPPAADLTVGDAAGRPRG